jgi:UDP-glucose 6-dehydrogenase
MAKVAVFGLGYVGLTTAVGLASLGHRVIGIDTNEDLVNELKVGKVSIKEKELDAVLKKQIQKGALEFEGKIKILKPLALCTLEPIIFSSTLEY